MTNPRGHRVRPGFFPTAVGELGVPDTEDVIAGVDHAIELGYADPDRLGVGGWSYGGILTNYVITKSDRFKAAITGASEVLYRANYGHDHYQRQWEAELGLPWENAAAWERITPFNDVAKVVTPTLIMGGEHDWNVPIQNSEQLYQALRRLGVETQLVVYPNEFHGISKPAFQPPAPRVGKQSALNSGGASSASLPVILRGVQNTSCTCLRYLLLLFRSVRKIPFCGRVSTVAVVFGARNRSAKSTSLSGNFNIVP